MDKTAFEYWRDTMKKEAVKRKDGFILELYLHMDYLYKYVGDTDYFYEVLAYNAYDEKKEAIEDRSMIES